MKTFAAIAFSLLTLGTTMSFAQGHAHHVKHNMVLYGEHQIFASHIVYKVPHNYQVILEVALDPESRRLYLAERARFPADRIVLLLDESSIAHIERLPRISGTILRTDAQGKKITVVSHLTIPRARYRVVYFSELPLSLGAELLR